MALIPHAHLFLFSIEVHTFEIPTILFWIFVFFLSFFLFSLEYRSWVKSWETTEGAESGFWPRVDEDVLRRPSRQGKAVEVLMEHAPNLYP